MQISALFETYKSQLMKLILVLSKNIVNIFDIKSFKKTAVHDIFLKKTMQMQQYKPSVRIKKSTTNPPCFHKSA